MPNRKLCSELMHSFNNLALEYVLGADGVLDALLRSVRVSPQLAVKLVLQVGGER